MAIRNDAAVVGTFAVQRSILKNVYLWMTAGLAITGVVAFYIASNTQIVQALATQPFLFFALVIAEFGLVFFLTARLHTMSPGAATLGFAAYAVLNGVTLSLIFVAYTGASIARAFFVAAATFGVMSVWAMTTKKDLTRMGNYLFMGLVGIIIASLVNMFLRSSGLDWLISFVGVFLFLGLTAYDTQIIQRWSRELGDSVGEADYMRVSIMGALKLYLDFINLFLFLLRFLGRRN